jgi:hypothetical protein
MGLSNDDLLCLDCIDPAKSNIIHHHHHEQSDKKCEVREDENLFVLTVCQRHKVQLTEKGINHTYIVH